MSVDADLLAPKTATLGTTLTRIIPGKDVEVVWVNCATDLYLVYSKTLVDTSVVPASDRFPIPAGQGWPIKVRAGWRMLVAAQSGAPEAGFMADRN